MIRQAPALGATLSCHLLREVGTNKVVNGHAPFRGAFLISLSLNVKSENASGAISLDLFNLDLGGAVLEVGLHDVDLSGCQLPRKYIEGGK